MDNAQVGAVAVVGGGVIGMSVALALAAGGVDCVLVDPSPGRGATWAAAGMLSPAAEVAPGEEGLVRDLSAALELWPVFAARVESLSGIDVGFTASSSLLVGARQSDEREVARSAGLIGRAGMRVTPLDGVAVRELEPVLASGLRAGWLLADDHRVDNRLLAEALLAAIKANGVRIVEDRCTALSLSAAGVELTLEHQGTLDVTQCVLATGAAPPIGGAEQLGLPRVRPVRGITLRLGHVEGVELPTRTIRAVVDATHCYLVPRADGSLVVGATIEEQGFLAIARAGGVYRLLEAARQVLPAVDELSFDEAAVGFRPATDDHVPVVRRLGDSPIVAALGHYRNGVLLSPLAAQRAAAIVRGAT